VALYVVTGANTGIGKLIASDLAARGLPVVLACRNLAKAEAARDAIRLSCGNAPEVQELDLASLKSVRRFADRLSSEKRSVAVLVNNAGLFAPQYELTEDGHELTWQTNQGSSFSKAAPDIQGCARLRSPESASLSRRQRQLLRSTTPAQQPATQDATYPAEPPLNRTPPCRGLHSRVQTADSPNTNLMNGGNPTNLLTAWIPP
jgi:NAD(P)-dependent dehydrogenase (short-subunit alcohol dehydrogenase family)